MALKKQIETKNMVLTAVEERRLEHQWHRLEQQLAPYAEPLVALKLTSHPARRLVQADLRLRLGPGGAQLISHQAAETADHAVALAVDDVLRQQERHRARLRHEASYGVPSRRETREHRRPLRSARAGPEASGSSDGHEVAIAIDPLALHATVHPVSLTGTLEVPEGADGLVVFAHGSGSSRHSPRNRRVAHLLRQAGLGTLLLDLLTAEEEAEDKLTGHLRFAVDLLAERLAGAALWLRLQPGTRGLPLGYFGASTGGGAALIAAAAHPELVGAVVSRGRPDLAGAALARVQAPTMLIVGSEDHPVVELNREALALLRAPKQLEIVPGATHLFEEPGALDRVAELARDWFDRYLIPGGAMAGDTGAAAAAAPAPR